MDEATKYFETKLKGLCLAELKVYKKRLDESIKQKISKNSPNEQIAPLILYRGILEHEMKKRMAQK